MKKALILLWVVVSFAAYLYLTPESESYGNFRGVMAHYSITGLVSSPISSVRKFTSTNNSSMHKDIPS